MTNTTDTPVYFEGSEIYDDNDWSWVTINSKSDWEEGSDIVTQEAWNYLRKQSTSRVWIPALDKFIDADALIPNLKFRACEIKMQEMLNLNLTGLTASKREMCETLNSIAALSQYNRATFEILIEARLR